MNHKDSSTFKRTLLLTPALGDWTTFKPEISETKIVRSGLYGFDKLSEEQLKRAHLVHYDLFQKIFQNLKKELQSSIQFHSISIHQLSYGEFLRSIAEQLVVHLKAKLDALSQYQIQVLVDLSLADIIINQSLGVKEEPKMQERSLTELEETALKEVFNLTFHSFLGTPIQFEIISTPKITPEPTISSNDTFIILTAEISIAENPPLKISLGYLHQTLKYILNKLETPTPALPLQKIDPGLAEKTLVLANSTLGTTTITTQEMSELNTGDVVCLDTPIHSPVSLNLGEEVSLPCKLGIKNGKLALQILSPYYTKIEAPATIEIEKEEPKIEPLKETVPKEEVEDNFEEEAEDLEEDLEEDFEEEEEEELEDEFEEEEDFEDDFEEEEPKDNV